MSTKSKAVLPEQPQASVFHASVFNDVEELQAALAHGESLNQARGQNGFTPLHTAAFNGSLAFIAEAVKHPSADPWAFDRNGRRAIDIAAAAGFKEIVELLYAAMYQTDENVFLHNGPDEALP